jgi:hypothetical protein
VAPGRPEPAAEHLELVLDYLRYHINAPCWEQAESFAEELAALRERVGQLQTAADVDGWIHDCLQIGLDPL